MTNEQYFKAAGEEARKSLCLRAKCGSVVVLNGTIVGRGYNAPPNDDVHDRRCEAEYADSLKPKSDRTCCIHAEWRAITNALRNVGDITNASLYFTRVDNNGELLFSGQPYCTVCSRFALDNGIKEFGLWHEAGITMYDTKRYNELTYTFHQ